jgi:hypothetical protein
MPLSNGGEPVFFLPSDLVRRIELNAWALRRSAEELTKLPGLRKPRLPKHEI